MQCTSKFESTYGPQQSPIALAKPAQRPRADQYGPGLPIQSSEGSAARAERQQPTVGHRGGCTSNAHAHSKAGKGSGPVATYIEKAPARAKHQHARGCDNSPPCTRATRMHQQSKRTSQAGEQSSTNRTRTTVAPAMRQQIQNDRAPFDTTLR